MSYAQWRISHGLFFFVHLDIILIPVLGFYSGLSDGVGTMYLFCLCVVSWQWFLARSLLYLFWVTTHQTSGAWWIFNYFYFLYMSIDFILFSVNASQTIVCSLTHIYIRFCVVFLSDMKSPINKKFFVSGKKFLSLRKQHNRSNVQRKLVFLWLNV
jgi:hypothetical protein